MKKYTPRPLPCGGMTMPRPKYYECGICGCWHPAWWNGDCRDDEHRFSLDELDELHGALTWDEVPMPGTVNN